MCREYIPNFDSDKVKAQAESDAFERLSERVSTDGVIEEVEELEETTQWDWYEYWELAERYGYE